jgi:hypothetical protein
MTPPAGHDVEDEDEDGDPDADAEGRERDAMLCARETARLDFPTPVVPTTATTGRRVLDAAVVMIEASRAAI